MMKMVTGGRNRGGGGGGGASLGVRMVRSCLVLLVLVAVIPEPAATIDLAKLLEHRILKKKEGTHLTPFLDPLTLLET